MGQAKEKNRDGFSPALIAEWEAEDCINFAVALARVSGWVLHVDWLVKGQPPYDNLTNADLLPIRVYVQDNRDGIFDVRGIKTAVEFSEKVIFKRLKGMLPSLNFNGGVVTRFYTEAQMFTLPLRSFPSESKIKIAITEIQKNITFLKSIPIKPSLAISAYDAARYTFGNCGFYAEAMHELAGPLPVAILVKEFVQEFKGTKTSENGYVHSIVVHPDGMGEDAWGKSSIEDIAARFGAKTFEISRDAHQQVMQKLFRTSPETYDKELSEARSLISQSMFRSIAQ
jgi:hypothetical protein